MSSILCPLRLEFLELDAPRQLVEAAFDPSLLPRPELARDVNPGTAFLGDEVSSPPFQNRNLLLPPGVHLHWQLPRDFVRARRGQPESHAGGIYPAIPNRWLIARSASGYPDQKWVVESDYLHPEGSPTPPGGVAYPFLKEAVAGGTGFRWLGRALDYEAWLRSSGQAPAGDYLSGLTVMAWGNPAFAAFYPDCRGVLGFHDPFRPAADTAVTYQVVGWYSDSRREPFPDAAALRGPGGPSGPAGLLPQLFCGGAVRFFSGESRTLRESHFLTLAEARARRASLRREGPPPSAPQPSSSSLAVGIGNTATEALSALLARRLSDGDPAVGGGMRGVYENQLEGILMAGDLEPLLQDQQARFVQLRHAKGFTAVQGGERWIIKPETAQDAPADAQGSPPPGTAKIPKDCLLLLEELHHCQRGIGKLQDAAATQRDRLSSEWHKYLLCAHPPSGEWEEFPEPDRVKYLIETQTLPGIAKIRRKLERTLARREEAKGKIGLLLDAQNAKAAKQAAAATPPAKAVTLRLKSEPGPRFWMPRDPVLVVEAPPELQRHLPEADEYHQSAGSAWKELPVSDPRDPLFQALGKALSAGVPPGAAMASSLMLSPKFNTFFPPAFPARGHHEDPARPVFVEWDVGMEALRTGSLYSADQLAAHYAPGAGEPDLVPRGIGKGHKVAGGPSEPPANYQGRSLVSASAPRLLHERLENYLIHHFLPEYAAFPKPAGSDAEQRQAAVDFLREPGNLDAAIQATADGRKSPANTALRAYQYIRGQKILCLPLGGFHQSVLMRRQTPQVSPADPSAFPEYRKFAETVRAALESLPTSAPVPLSAFHPIRGGALEIRRLRVIDSFGRGYDLDLDRSVMAPAETLGTSSAILPPRFAQPLRADFHWLSAGEPEVIANSHPESSPLCGWLLPNRLDESIVVYDAAGDCLGSVDGAGNWRPMPGDEHPTVPADIGNPHLRQLVLHILSKAEKGDYSKALLETISAALDAIDPDGFAANPSLALLVARPVAVVRASVSFALRGEPFEDHSWEFLKARIAGLPVDASRSYEKVAIPFRIGEHRLLNDGVVGYWVEDPACGFKDDRFHAPQTDAPRHPLIVSWHGDSAGSRTAEAVGLTLKLAPGAEPMKLTMLLDPRGSAHLTSGVVPVKEIRLDDAHWLPAMRRMSVTFLSAPLLMLKDRTEILLPGEPGYAWSFLDRSPQGWKETPASRISPPETAGVFRGPVVLREGWLRLDPLNSSASPP